MVNHAKQPLLIERFENKAPGIKAFKTWLKLQQVAYDENSLLVIENTGVYHWLIRSFCSTHNLPLHTGNAAHIKYNALIDKALLTMLGKAHKAALEGIKKSRVPIEAMMAQIIQQHKAVYTNYQLIKTGPGIGHLTAVYIICCTNNFAAKVRGK